MCWVIEVLAVLAALRVCRCCFEGVISVDMFSSVHWRLKEDTDIG